MSANDFLLLLPPTEGKALDGKPNIRWSYDNGIFGDALATQRALVVAQLRKEKGGAQKLLGVSGVHLTRAHSSNMQLVGAPCLPAWQRYTGVVWDHLDLASLTAIQRNAFTKRIIVPSGLLGLVRADDPIPDYRLKMGARLAPFGTMSKFWNEALTDALVAVAKKKAVVDLLPNEHRAAINWNSLDNVVRIDLVSHSGAVVGGHNAKAAKGLLARHLLVSTNTDVRRTVASFKHPEYSAKVST